MRCFFFLLSLLSKFVSWRRQPSIIETSYKKILTKVILLFCSNYIKKHHTVDRIGQPFWYNSIKYDKVISKLFHFIPNLLGIFRCSFINFNEILCGSIYFLIKLDELRSKYITFFLKFDLTLFSSQIYQSNVIVMNILIFHASLPSSFNKLKIPLFPH